MAGVDLGPPIGLRDRAMLAVLCATGMRCGEMAQLEIGDLDLERSVELVREGKGGKERLIPLGDRALHRVSNTSTRPGCSSRGTSAMRRCSWVERATP